MKIVPVDDEIRASRGFQEIRRAWPEIVFHDAISNEHWSRLYSERPEFQFALVEDGELLAEGNSIPVGGMPASWREAFMNGFGGGSPDRLCALAILIDPDHQGKGLSKRMLEHMRGLARERGWELVAPVRPSLKDRYPLTPVERYAAWRRPDGLLFDPWLRAHERLGAEVLGIAEDSLVSEGTVSEFEEWAGLAFPESGSYVVPGALVPVEIDRERDCGVYREPNVWMRHPFTPGRLETGRSETSGA
jgi:GNAT superfamily N-acetyltransferase